MRWYSALVTVDRLCTREDGALVDRLADFRAVVSAWPDGRLSVRMSLTGASMPQAATRAVTVMRSATGAEPVALELLTEAEFYAREGFELSAE